MGRPIALQEVHIENQTGVVGEVKGSLNQGGRSSTSLEESSLTLIEPSLSSSLTTHSEYHDPVVAGNSDGVL